MQAWSSQAASASPLSDTLKELYETVLNLNIHLVLSYISSEENPAEEPPRKKTIGSRSCMGKNLVRRLYKPVSVDFGVITTRISFQVVSQRV